MMMQSNHLTLKQLQAIVQEHQAILADMHKIMDRHEVQLVRLTEGSLVITPHGIWHLPDHLIVRHRCVFGLDEPLPPGASARVEH
jgi:hypothetical protein